MAQLYLTSRSAPVAETAPSPLPSIIRPGKHPGLELLTVTAQQVRPEVVVITVRGEVDLGTSPQLRVSLLAQLRRGTSSLVVDLTEVGFFGVAGLTVLITARQAALAAGIRLCVVAHGRAVLRPLSVTGLDRLFDLHPDLAHALLCQNDAVTD